MRGRERERERDRKREKERERKRETERERKRERESGRRYVHSKFIEDEGGVLPGKHNYVNFGSHN